MRYSATHGCVRGARTPRTIHVVPLTTNTTRAMPTEVPIVDAGLTVASAAQTHLCTVVSVQRLIDAPATNVGPVDLARIRETLAELIDI